MSIVGRWPYQHISTDARWISDHQQYHLQWFTLLAYIGLSQSHPTFQPNPTTCNNTLKTTRPRLTLILFSMNIPWNRPRFCKTTTTPPIFSEKKNASKTNTHHESLESAWTFTLDTASPHSQPIPNHSPTTQKPLQPSWWGHLVERFGFLVFTSRLCFFFSRYLEFVELGISDICWIFVGYLVVLVVIVTSDWKDDGFFFQKNNDNGSIWPRWITMEWGHQLVTFRIEKSTRKPVDILVVYPTICEAFLHPRWLFESSPINSINIAKNHPAWRSKKTWDPLTW